jgi:hypothetical protein
MGAALVELIVIAALAVLLARPTALAVIFALCAAMI